MAFTQKMWVVSLHVVCQGSPKAPNTGYAVVLGHPELDGMMYAILLNCHMQFFTEKVTLEAKFPSSPLQTQPCFSQSVLKGPCLEMTPPKEKRTPKEPKTENTMPLQTARR